ncbi:hypothetical protein OsI_02212 [Oryza sativa Indica Group]|uniref:Uncharacterized protein n=1 Tax=Oryza sativa subsp. indica TaxID=39946 RepID=A2WQS8_ORYSI|nr:hypothetical protein OsI_02212 [Oryza sativa Indica Group]
MPCDSRCRRGRHSAAWRWPTTGAVKPDSSSSKAADCERGEAPRRRCGGNRSGDVRGDEGRPAERKMKFQRVFQMENGAQRKRKVPLIHRVQNNIHLAEKNAYDPVLISIGPYHHGTPSLAAAEKDKWASLDYILKLNQERNLQDYLHVLSSLPDRARNTYSEEIEMDEDKFLQMLLLDGCFIIVSLYGTAGLFVRKQEVCDGSSKNKAEVSEVELTDFNAEESIQRDQGQRSINTVQEYSTLVIFLLSLPKDVTILAKRGIIVHQMHSDDEVSVLFTKLGKNVDFDVNGKYYLRHLCHVMEEHYQSRLNREKVISPGYGGRASRATFGGRPGGRKRARANIAMLRGIRGRRKSGGSRNHDDELLFSVTDSTCFYSINENK